MINPSLESRLFGLVTADSAITNHIGTRFYPDVAPDDVQGQTYAVFTVVSDVPYQTFQGPTTNLSKFRVQIDCYSMDRPDCDLLAREIDNVLGNRITSDPQSYRVDRRTSYMDRRKQYRISMDYSMHVREV